MADLRARIPTIVRCLTTASSYAREASRLSRPTRDFESPAVPTEPHRREAMYDVREGHRVPRATREKPARLAEKLVTIRHTLGLSQEEIIRHMGLTDRLSRDDVSKYERGLREPRLRTR